MIACPIAGADTARVGAYETGPGILPCRVIAREPTSYRRERPRAPTVGDSLPPPGRQENAETQRQVPLDLAESEVRSLFANVTPSDVTIG